MTPDRIEREILIDAPPEVVWKVITEPEHVAAWFSDEAAADVRPGGEGRRTWVEGGRVKNVEDNAPLVEFRLFPEGERTRLSLSESGIGALERTDHEKAAFVESHGRGWDFHLGELAAYAAQLEGAPARR